MTSIVLKEYGKISSIPADEGSNWTYEPDLPKKLREEDFDLQKELENNSNLVIEKFSDGLRVKAGRSAGIAQFSDFSISVEPRFVSPENFGGHGIQVADIDNDGWLDVYVTHIFDPKQNRPDFYFVIWVVALSVLKR